jgi:hypothetical protein
MHLKTGSFFPGIFFITLTSISFRGMWIDCSCPCQKETILVTSILSTQMEENVPHPTTKCVRIMRISRPIDTEISDKICYYIDYVNQTNNQSRSSLYISRTLSIENVTKLSLYFHLFVVQLPLIYAGSSS